MGHQFLVLPFFTLDCVHAHSCVGPISEHQLYLPFLPGLSWTRVEGRRWLLALFRYSTRSFRGCVCGFCNRVSAGWKLHRSLSKQLFWLHSAKMGPGAAPLLTGSQGSPVCHGVCLKIQSLEEKKKKTPAGSDPLFPKILEVLPGTGQTTSPKPRLRSRATLGLSELGGSSLSQCLVPRGLCT